MTVTIRPELESELQAQLAAGPYRSADELVNAALAQFMADDFEPGELNALVEAGVADAAAGRLVDGEDFERELQERRRRRQA